MCVALADASAGSLGCYRVSLEIAVARTSLCCCSALCILRLCQRYWEIIWYSYISGMNIVVIIKILNIK